MLGEKWWIKEDYCYCTVMFHKKDYHFLEKVGSYLKEKHGFRSFEINEQDLMLYLFFSIPVVDPYEQKLKDVMKKI